ncbi:MAG TPA: hypothetical protein VI136_05100 [Verrucomicrobiae bacterium]
MHGTWWSPKLLGKETSRQRDYEPGAFRWPETAQPQYVRVAEWEAAPIIAPAPAQVSDYCLAPPALLAQLFLSKDCDPRPSSRQQ